MPIDLKTVEKIAALAKLDHGGPDQAGLPRLAEELAGLIDYLDILKELDTTGVEPLYSPLLEAAGPRPDRPGPGAAGPDELLDLAPDRVGRFYTVPKII